MLEEIYTEELNPGLKIGKILNLLFPKQRPQSCNELCFFDISEGYKVSFRSDIHDFIKEVVEWVLNKSSSNKTLSYVFADLLDPYAVEIKDQMSPLELLIALLQLGSEELARLWLHRTLLPFPNYDEGKRKIEGRELLKILQILPLGKGATPYNEEEAASCINSCLLNNLYLPLDDVVEMLYILEYFCSESGYDFKEEDVELLYHIMHTFAKFRKECFSGGVFYDFESLMLVDHLFFNHFELSELDLAVLLATGEGHYANDLLVLHSTDKIQNLHDEMEFFNSKQRIYLNLFDKCIRKNLPELGNSLLSLYIIARAIHAKGRFGNLPELTKVIEVGLRHPGCQILRETINLVCECISEFSSRDSIAQISLYHLQRFQLQKPTFSIFTGGGTGEVRHSTESIRAILINQLDKERWAKLSKESQELVISAEHSWKNNAIQFGFEIKDWSGVILPYFKVFEHELRQRFDAIYMSEEYRQYLVSKNIKRDRNSTASKLLFMISQFYYLPATLQDRFVTLGIDVLQCKNIVQVLEDLIRQYRHTSAHAEVVDMVSYTQFKCKMYEYRVFHKFIDLFCFPMNGATK